MEELPDQRLAVEMESVAVEMAREAGRMLQARFRGQLEVEYKDDKKQDPVTSADKECQAYLIDTISSRFPDHGVIGEEGGDDVDAADATAPDTLWILDPLDGTTNFLNGLPLYGVSIGVLQRGTPLVAAIFIPWPGEAEGLVLHARRGAGAWLNEERLALPRSEGPEAVRLIALPGSFGAMFRVRKEMAGRLGQPRMTGSIVYELALTACGAFQYVVFGGPKIWDVAAGALLIVEAGGAVLVRRRASRRWEPMESLGPSWDGDPPSLKEVRGWTAPMIAGNSGVAPLIASGLRRRRSSFRGTVSGWMRRMGRRSK